MDLEEQTRENTRNISSLATSVTELATMFKYTEKSREEERLDVRAAVDELKSLNNKIASMANVQKEVATLSSDVRTMNHDVRNIQSSLVAIGLLKDKQVECEKKSENHEARINEIEKKWDKADGATGAVKVVVHMIWAFVSVGGIGFVAWLFGLWGHSGGRISGE